MTTETQAPPTSVAETLRRARALIEDPKRWTKGALARPSNRTQVEVSVDSPTAHAWCALGAVRHVDGPYQGRSLEILVEAIVGNLAHASEEVIWEFNDDGHRRHRDVLAAFDKAIALAEYHYS